MSNKLNLTLKVWRQESSGSHGDFVDYSMEGVNPHMSFLELLDVLNERLITEGIDPIAFEHDCREGICRAAQNYDRGDSERNGHQSDDVIENYQSPRPQHGAR